MKSYKYVFKFMWRNKWYNNMTVIGFSIECNDEQIAREQAFRKAMKIHKNMCMNDKEFSNNWYYVGTQLLQVVPIYW